MKDTKCLPSGALQSYSDRRHWLKSGVRGSRLVESSGVHVGPVGPVGHVSHVWKADGSATSASSGGQATP